MKNELKELIKILLISSVIGALVASPFNIILNQKWPDYITISAFVGFCIGLIAFIAYYIVSLWINHHTLIAFLAVFLIIAIGTSLAVYLLAAKDIILIICFTSLAELAGMTMTFISWRSSIKLNCQLEKTKSRISNI